MLQRIAFGFIHLQRLGAILSIVLLLFLGVQSKVPPETYELPYGDTDCIPGYFAVQDRRLIDRIKVICVLCPEGQYNPYTGPSRLPCYDCPAGTYSSDDRTSCDTCSKGRYFMNKTDFFNDTATHCVSCPIGTYNDKEKPVWNCTPCGKGLNTTSDGSTSYHDCYCANANGGNLISATGLCRCLPGTSRSITSSRVICQPCGKGRYGDGTKGCYACPSRRTINNITTASSIKECACPPGTCADPGSAICRPILEHWGNRFVVGANSRDCEYCKFASGRHPNPTRTQCACPAGRGLDTSLPDSSPDFGVCFLCGSDEYNDGTSETCMTCPTGSYVYNTLNRCACPQGKANPSCHCCETCKNGTFNDGRFDTCQTADQCPQGSGPYASLKTTPVGIYCACPPGTGWVGEFWNPKVTPQGCMSCAVQNPIYYNDGTLFNCGYCANHTAIPINNATACGCLPGLIYNYYKTDFGCTQCPGSSIPINSFTACGCNSPLVFNETGNMDCACPSGTSLSALGTCVKGCLPGYYKASDGLCLPCSPGHYQDKVDQTYCPECALHTYQDQSAATSCIPCPAATPFTADPGTVSVSLCFP